MTFVDKVLALECGRRGVGLKNVSANEHYFREGKVLPEGVVTDALAEMTGIVLGKEPLGPGRLARVGGMEFRRPVRPGDQLILYSEIAERTDRLVRARVRAEVLGETVAEGEVVLAVDEEV